MNTKKYTVEVIVLDTKNDEGLYNNKEVWKALDIIKFDEVVISLAYQPKKRKPEWYIATYRGISTKLKSAFLSVNDFMEEMEHTFGKGKGVEQAIINRYNELKLV